MEIPEALFKRLQNNAIPLVDTPATIIERLLNHFESITPTAPNAIGSANTAEIKVYDPLAPPDLLFTHVRGQFDSVDFDKWNALVRLSHIKAFQKAKTFEQLVDASYAHLKEGRYEEEGYHYVPEIDISIQGVDSRRAWAHSLRLARYLKVPIKATFQWRQTHKAAFPGEIGILKWSP